MDPEAKSLPHEHTNYEEFLMIDGKLIDPDNKVFKKGDFITFEPGSAHSSYTKNGCLILVFQRGKNKPIKKNSVEKIYTGLNNFLKSKLNNMTSNRKITKFIKI